VQRRETPTTASLWRGAFVCAVAGLIVFQFFGNSTRGYIPTRSLFVWWGSQWFNPASETQHGPLVLLIAMWLFRRNLGSADARPEASPRVTIGLGAMLTGLAFHVLGYALQQTRLSIGAWLVFVWGWLAFAGGRRWARAGLFPLAFLLLAMPFNFLDSVGFYLQLGVTRWAHGIVHLLGIDVVRNGTQLFAPDGRYQYDVAAACSGVRSLVALLALSLLVGYLRCRSFTARGAVVLAGLGLVFAGNVLRITAIILAGEWFGRHAGENVHAFSGVLVFVFVLGALLAGLALLERFYPSLDRRDGRRQGRSGFGVSAGTLSADVAAAAVFLAGVAAALGVMKLDTLAVSPVAGVKLAPDGLNPIELPTSVGAEWFGRKEEVTALERQILPPDTGYSRKTYIPLENPDRQVFFSVVLSGRDRSSIHRPELCLVGQGWTIIGRSEQRLEAAGGPPVRATVLRIQREVMLPDKQRVTVPALLMYWFVNDETTVPSYREMLWRGGLDRLRHLRADRWAYVVEQTLALDGEAPARARMQEVFASVWPAMRTAQPTHP
jgi:exosortase